MKLAYVDTSFVVAVALGEKGASRHAARLGRFQRLISSNLMEAELRAALAREEVDSDPAPLLSWFHWVHPDRPLSREFHEVLAAGHVRGADLWHLACALFLKASLGDLTFLTLDRPQQAVAKSLGFRA